jgi:hypothetical protein
VVVFGSGILSTGWIHMGSDGRMDPEYDGLRIFPFQEYVIYEYAVDRMAHAVLLDVFYELRFDQEASSVGI